MANEALNTVRKIVKDLTTLEVVTLVTEIQVNKQQQPDGSEKTTFAAQDQAVAKGCVTTINMVDGDIRNYIGDGLADEEYDRITQFHSTQVEKGQEVIRSTISALKDAAQLIKELTTSS